MIRIEVLSPAKLNLNLKILNRRPDGYHNIQTIIQFVDFGDNMTFELTKDRGVQLISNEKIQNNLILKAADMIEENLLALLEKLWKDYHTNSNTSKKDK